MSRGTGPFAIKACKTKIGKKRRDTPRQTSLLKGVDCEQEKLDRISLSGRFRVAQ
jgi:hypothetical protein